MVIFADRVEAGRRMVRELEVVRGELGLPRGGVPVASVLDARLRRLRRGRQRIDLTGRVAVIVDDSIATGSTARVACQVARRLGARRVIMAAPVAAAETIQHLPEADAVVCVSVPDRFVAVSAH